MNARRVNWLVYTCLVGLIPTISRLVVWMISKDGGDALAISDLVAFGLVLHSANINEVSRLPDADESWKTIHNGVSILFLVIYALLLFTTIASSDNLNKTSILYTTLLLCLVSFVLGWNVLSRAQAAGRVVV